MAKFNEFFIPSSDSVDVEEIYKKCLYRPTADVLGSSIGHLTFEALNGGLTVKDDGSIKVGGLSSEYFRAGSFARGYSYGFNFPDRYHEAQFSEDPGAREEPITLSEFQKMGRPVKKYFVNSYSMCSTVFVPWNAVVYVSYQGFFGGDYRRYVPASSSGGGVGLSPGAPSSANNIGSRAYTRLYVDGAYQYGTECLIPPSRSDTKTPHEDLFRWNHKGRMLHLSKGYHTFTTKIYLFMINPETIADVSDKLANFCGSMSILAIKSGYDHNVTSFKEWYGKDDTFPDYT